MKVMCVTGHRPNSLPIEYGYDYTKYNWRRAVEAFKKVLIDENIRIAITGMALGTDMAFAKAVMELKALKHNIELHCYIPCEGQSDKWNWNSQAYYHRILENADKIVYISKHYTKDCMIRRNIAMVNNSDVVLAFYDGRTYGGTYNTVNYAKSNNKRVITIDPKDYVNTKAYKLERAINLYEGINSACVEEYKDVMFATSNPWDFITAYIPLDKNINEDIFKDLGLDYWFRELEGLEEYKVLCIGYDILIREDLYKRLKREAMKIIDRIKEFEK